MEQKSQEFLNERASSTKRLADVCQRIVAAAATFVISGGQLGLPYNLPSIFENQHLCTLW